MSIALQAWVSGRVQGVWFRQGTAEQAATLGVHGWVRNLPDGRVEAWLEGEELAVRGLARWLEQGPPKAAVTGVQVQEQAPQGYTDFEVRR
ncbi:acylphosphatase [Pseudomonas flexibilis]|uniref:Acylphosphatase n=1 Tax=Pseudomonas flexibilis TaxID=706570 RepID=A0A0B3BX36_9PSED|nr:acylphosphatase [Pseudomonas flexibilis]KHO65621.1 acylphosphatase [Pseudomonas flexibilis]SCX79284.1 acylphosphatase [Pseudomonas flexibilis]